MTDPKLHKAAIWYARHGWRVHPCRSRDKKPLLSAWQKKASTEQGMVSTWWQQWTEANVAIATGPQSGIWVLDIDGEPGEAALAELERKHGGLPTGAPTQFTGGGGRQMFFAWPEGRRIRNSASQLGRHIDIRGDGGYTIVPPSIHPSGTPYRWADGLSPAEVTPMQAPAWLITLIDPPKPKAPEPAPVITHPNLTRYVAAAVKNELETVERAREGTRNDRLNAAAFSLGQFIAAGWIPDDWARHRLEERAVIAGLTLTEARQTIDSGIRAGRANPRETA
ncbi:bifunctional DNA primase/polymerase [Fodinicurvata fenggangensis]|uniref:bifunctional DNA primase/polymerase n=1 Tax=Fodinicurvata fenggangensis TaxID=1121830 RepID=UPI00068D8FAD|nr:bifunctional DNA primase/polymerase [Fodinicurvata fenggangensis]